MINDERSIRKRRRTSGFIFLMISGDCFPRIPKQCYFKHCLRGFRATFPSLFKVFSLFPRSLCTLRLSLSLSDCLPHTPSRRTAALREQAPLRTSGTLQWLLGRTPLTAAVEKMYRDNPTRDISSRCSSQLICKAPFLCEAAPLPFRNGSSNVWYARQNLPALAYLALH